ncbi:MAG TPA: M1 family metallopeptidase [Chryseosolibacter sp.]|nr:M1 family metallopeptidase [Chryseosolibacter sp.]
MKQTLSHVFTMLIFLSCSTNKTMEQKPVTKPDPHSFSQPADARVKHLSWKADVNFESKVITAIATWTIEKTNDADIVLFDTKDLKISKVTLDNDQPTEFKIAETDSILGEALAVMITPNTSKVNIHYQTSPDAEALQWLSPQQTAGKVHPFMFTQSQAILARSWVPCQDSPSIRFTYDADVTVPKDLLALMSASNPKEKNVTGEYHFDMKQPIASYLLALAVGDVAFKAISDRSGIYAEPTILEHAAFEFADLEKMIAGAEELYGPYQWERYDVIVLPPSFPFGGMENPRLTFATPTILAGDRSLTSLIAHELAHSWSGNLVTNSTWDDFWLNEGFTVYFETRIMEKLYGKDYAEMLASLNLQDLRDEVQALKEAGLSADTKLKLDLEGRNPDDGVTDIAYNKGYYFLRSVEEKHGREKFDAFLKSYFTENAFKSMGTDDFISYVTNYYQSNFGITLDENHFNEWIFSEGLPANVPQPNASRFAAVDKVIAAWTAEQPLKKEVAKDWSTHEWLHFLKNLPTSLSQQQMVALDNFGNFTASGNSEVITAWGVISIRNQYEQMYPKIETFLINTGRRKFLSPLYSELIKTEEGKARARAIYEKARPNYHFVATNTFDKLLAQ